MRFLHRNCLIYMPVNVVQIFLTIDFHFTVQRFHGILEQIIYSDYHIYNSLVSFMVRECLNMVHLFNLLIS